MEDRGVREIQLDELEKWLKTQWQLPQNIDRFFLRRFLSCMEGDLEDAKHLIEVHYKMRNKHDNIFLKRDPLDESSQKILEVADLLQLPGKTKENYKLILYRLRDPDPEKFNFTDAIKVFFMMADCRFATDDEDLSGEVPIFDMTGYTLRHVARTSLLVLRMYMKFIQEAHPVRIKKIHFLNAPSYLDKIMMVVRPFIKSDLMKMLQFHLPNADAPLEFVPPEMLPEEYGGKAGTLTELRSYWSQKLKEKREFIMDESKWKINKTNKSPTNTELVTGLRKLDID